MRCGRCRLFALFVALAVLAAPAAAERRIALVIGNATYLHQSKLPNPARDAKSVAEKLEQLGFSTVWLEQDLNRDELRRKLIDFGDEAASADWALLYYAGHGIEIGGTNYLIPVDAELKRDKLVRIEAVPLSEVMEAVESAKQLRLVILDACRNNPFIPGMMRSGDVSRAAGRGLARVEPNKGTLVAYAARDGQLAADGSGDNSPYVSALLKHMGTPGLEISLMFRRVRDAVLEETGGGQEPFTYGSLPGVEYYFNPGQGEAPEPAAHSAAPDRDEIVWAGIVNSQERQDFAFYLRQFPDGKYAAEAKARLDTLPDTAQSGPVADPKDATLVTDSTLIKEMQERLFELNYEPGQADGRLGSLTVQAVRDLQTDINLPSDGLLTLGLVKRLRAAGSLKPWGAILYAPATGGWGMAWGEETRSQAIAAARKSCGGLCDKELTFFKGWCGAFAHAPDGWALSSRDGIKQAQEQALARCRAQSSRCKLHASVCADGSDQFVSAE